MAVEFNTTLDSDSNSNESSDYVGYARDFAENRGTYKTTDNGETWTKINDIAYIGYEFPTENIGYARSSKSPGSVLENGDVCQCEDGTYKTTNGGLTWNKIYDQVFSFKSFPSEDIGYGKLWPVGGAEGGQLYKTTDGGQNWT